MSENQSSEVHIDLDRAAEKFASEGSSAVPNRNYLDNMKAFMDIKHRIISIDSAADNKSDEVKVAKAYAKLAKDEFKYIDMAVQILSGNIAANDNQKAAIRLLKDRLSDEPDPIHKLAVILKQMTDKKIFEELLTTKIGDPIGALREKRKDAFVLFA